MKRGDVVTVALPGAFGKPRPAVIVQDDAFAAVPSVTVLPITSTTTGAATMRVAIEPATGNGLKKASEVMVDKISTVPRLKLGARVGTLASSSMRAIDFALARFLGLT